MISKNNSHNKKQLISNSVKFMIAAASVAGTLGLWGIFSKRDVQVTTTQSTEDPLPTIVPLVNVDNTILVPATATVDTSIADLPVVTPPPSNSASANNTNIQVLPPAPVTVSKSSRP